MLDALSIVLIGLLVSETDEGVVLKDANGRETRLTADEIDFQAPQERSMMPDNLLQALTPAQAADLLEYLRGLQ